jgi:UDP-glucose 4-epimerase
VDAADPREQFEANADITYTLLERMRAVGVTNLAFTSSSTVYGEAPLPTPEDFAPLEPISAYGATKLAEESLCSVYAHSHDVSVWTVRFANIVGPALRGAVGAELLDEVRDDPTELESLGDGRQEKSYMHVEDCVAALCHVVEHAADGPLHTYNLGTRTTTSVTRIADVVSEELDVDPTYSYTGGDRGWTGDVPRMRLSVEKLAALGFESKLSSDEAVRRATRELAEEF